MTLPVSGPGGGSGAVSTVAISQTGTDNDVDANITNASLAVTGPLTDAQLRATPVPVSGTVSVTEPVSVDDNSGSLTVDNATLAVVGGGTEATALRVTVANDSTGVLSVDDNGGALTVDGSVALLAGTANIGDVDVLTVPAPLSTTGGGTEATALRVTLANDSTGLVSVDDNGGSLTVDGTVTANPALGFGKTLNFGTIAQGAAGTTELVAAQGGSNRVKVVSYVVVMSLTGTVKFTSTADLTGAMDIATNGGVSAISDVANPMFQTAANGALNIVTTLGAARGHFSYIVEA